MTEASSKPVLHVMRECPFCREVRLFLLEAGLLDGVSVREFAPGTEEERAIRKEPAPHVTTVSFPVVRFEDGAYPWGGPMRSSPGSPHGPMSGGQPCRPSGRTRTASCRR